LAKRVKINKHLRVQILARDGYKCRMCGRTKDEVPLEVDHIVALADDGTDELANLATLCRDCNGGKSRYRFTDYTAISIIPDDLEEHFRLVRDDKTTGDFDRFHLYCDYSEHGASGTGSGKYHWEWKVSGSDQATSGSSILVRRRQVEESAAFKKHIRLKLIAEGKRLLETDGRLFRL
jgi:HNH endonuclease